MDRDQTRTQDSNEETVREGVQDSLERSLNQNIQVMRLAIDRIQKLEHGLTAISLATTANGLSILECAQIASDTLKP